MSDDKTDALLDSTLRDVYHVVIKPMQLEIADLTKQLAESQRHNAELRGFIERWCKHDRQCKVFDMYPCDCGFREAIEKVLSGGG